MSSTSRLLVNMKASFVLTLLALYLSAGATELPHLANALSFQTPRDALAAALDARDGRVLNSVSKQNTSHFYPIIEYGYYRSGTFITTRYGSSIDQCMEYCRNSHNCLAVNYYVSGRQCNEFKELTNSLSSSSSWATVLINYKNGGDPCDSVYMLSGRGRFNFYYRYYPAVETPTAKDCCVKCREDPESKCKAWTYNTSGKYCYLLDGTPPLTTSSGWVTGYAVVNSDNE